MISEIAAELLLLAELRRARSSGATIPDFFVVGHAKSGTTALHGMLSSHPGVYLPRLRETQFLTRGPQELNEDAPRPGVRPRTLAAYLALFAEARPDQRVGEISTAYLRTPEAAERIAALSPNAQIIAFFREPAAFVRSLHLQLLQVGFETERDLGRALALEPERAEGRQIPPDCPSPGALLYTRHTTYTEELRRYHELFGRERVLTVIYEDFRADNEGVVRDLLRFLDVDESLPIASGEANPTVRVRSRRGESWLNALATGRGPVGGVLGSAIRAAMPARLRRRSMHAVRRALVDRAPAADDREVIEGLRRQFAPEVGAFADYTGRDIVTQWGYESLL